MLFHLLCWAMVVPPALLVGLYVEKIAGHTQTDPSVDRTVVAIYTGLLLLSGPLLALSLLVPISPLVFVILLALVVLFTLSDKETRRSFSAAVSKLLNLQVIAGMAIIVPLAAYAAASRIKIYDTGLYHYPLTHWLATTGTVPWSGATVRQSGFHFHLVRPCRRLGSRTIPRTYLRRFQWITQPSCHHSLQHCAIARDSKTSLLAGLVSGGCLPGSVLALL